MMKILATTLLITLALSATASAQQRGSLTLGWDDCRLAGGAICETFACNTNSDSETHDLVAAYLAGNDITGLLAWSGHVNVFFESSFVVPPWWQFGAGPACRGTDDMTVAFTNAIGVSCFDYQAQVPPGAIGGQAYEWPSNQANYSRIRFVGVVDPAAAVHPPIAPGTETYLFNVVIRNGNTILPASPVCSGCAVPAKLTLGHVDFEQLNGDNFSVVYRSPNDPSASPDVPSSAIVGWQPGLDIACQAPTAAQSQTWGSIKSIYR